MMRVQVLFLFFVSLLLAGCSCGSGQRKGVLRVGVDADWYPLDFGAQVAYVNGFTSDLLIEIAHYSGMEFERIPANWDSLLEGLERGQYDVVLSSLPPYVFNRAKYDFSENFLDLGPVLIVPTGSHFTKLEQMEGKLVGVVKGDLATLLLEKYPEIVVRNYLSIPELFNAVVQGEIEGALHNRIPAINYVSDLYAGHLKIATAPMTDAGLHLVAPKGKHSRMIEKFDASLKQLKRKHQLEALQQKWLYRS